MEALFANLFHDAAGVSYGQHLAINKYTDWNARHFRGVKTFYAGADMTTENYNVDELVFAIEKADVIEFCSAEPQRQKEAEARIQMDIPGFKYGFDWREKTKNKVKIYHCYNSFVGHWKERAEDKIDWNRRERVGCDAIFSSIPQCVNVYKDCIYIPDIVDELSPEFTPDEKRNSQTVARSPGLSCTS